MGRFRLPNGAGIKILAFTAAASAVLAQAEAVPDLWRYGFAALSAGCGAVLALTRQPNQVSDSRPSIGGR